MSVSRLALDHLVVSARTLEEGVQYVADTLGVAPAGGGAHPLMRTHNRLLNLWGGAYLEVIAADPHAPSTQAGTRGRLFALDDPATRARLESGPYLSHWVARVEPPKSLERWRAQYPDRIAELVPKPWLDRAGLTTAVKWAARLGGVSAAAIAPALASYTAVLLSQTAVPAWHEAYRELPFVFTGSAAASGAGLAMICAPPAEAAPARRLALLGAAIEIVAAHRIDRRPQFETSAFTHGAAHRMRRASEYLTIGGACAALTFARRSRVAAALGGLALLAGSGFQRFGTFEAGVASTKDPAYVVKPQRERLDARQESEGDA